MEARNLRKTRTGVVVSDKMDKTIVVAAKYKERHPIYGKFVQKTKKLTPFFSWKGEMYVECTLGLY